MGGTIGVYSAGQGFGSEFWFTLPVAYHEPRKTISPRTKERKADHEDHASPVQNIARVAYDPSSDFVFSRPAAPVAQSVVDNVKTSLKDDRVMIAVPNDGVRRVLTGYLTRWGLAHDSGDSIESAEAAVAKSNTNKSSTLSVSVIVVDIDYMEVPAALLQTANIRFVLLCSDAHRRNVMSGKTIDPYAGVEHCTHLNKPVKRQAFWQALLSRGHVYEGSSKAAIDRTMSSFSKRNTPRGTKPISPAPAAPSPSASTTDSSLPERRGSLTLRPASPTPAISSGARILMAEDNLINIQVS